MAAREAPFNASSNIETLVRFAAVERRNEDVSGIEHASRSTARFARAAHDCRRGSSPRASSRRAVNGAIWHGNSLRRANTLTLLHE
jgi:hypothetical protein